MDGQILSQPSTYPRKKPKDIWHIHRLSSASCPPQPVQPSVRRQPQYHSDWRQTSVNLLSYHNLITISRTLKHQPVWAPKVGQGLSHVNPNINLSLDLILILTTKFEGSRPEWCVSNIIYSRDRPFWLETLNMWWDANATTLNVKTQDAQSAQRGHL